MDDTQNQNGAPVSGAPEPKKDYTKWIIGGVVVLAVLYGIQALFFSPARMMERQMERAIERETGADVDIDYDRGMMGGEETNVTYRGEDGESYTVSTGASVSLPDNWPQSVPVPKSANITYAGTMMAGGPGGGTTVSFTTSESVGEMTEYYKKELVQNGWTLASTMATGEGSMITAQKGDAEGVILYVAPTPEGTTVSMTVTAQ